MYISYLPTTLISLVFIFGDSYRVPITIPFITETILILNLRYEKKNIAYIPFVASILLTSCLLLKNYKDFNPIIYIMFICESIVSYNIMK